MRRRSRSARIRHLTPRGCRPTTIVLLVGAFLLAPAMEAEGQDYFPTRDSWERISPGEMGMSSEHLERARAIHMERQNTAPRDLAIAHQRGFAREPFGEQVGPFKVRGEPTAVVIRSGYIVAEWGEPYRVDPTFSVTKSFLSSTVGLAWDRGLIPDLHEPVARLMAPIEVESPECVAPRPPTGAFPQVPPPFEPFTGEHNSRITWDHLLRQTSDWEGMLWCKPDWGDRPDQDPDTWGTRERHEPGTTYEYNDVRVNLLALAALNVWRRPLPEILRDHLMDPIGASPTWRWMGYEDSWVTLDGRRIHSVSGGAHWGGGMFINAMDMARFGLLHLRGGRWEDRQLLSPEWLEMARTGGEANDGYGFMNYFLNPDGRGISSAPESIHFHVGAGSNIVYVDPDHDLVVVVRWIQRGALSDFIGAIIESIEE